MRQIVKNTMIHFLLWILIVFVIPVYCSISSLPAGAKYIALGGQVSSTEDVYSVYYNPACVDYVKQQQVAAEYTGMFVGLPESITRAFLGYAFPTKKVGSFGFYWTTLQASVLYSEHTFAFVYSKQKILSYVPNLSLGIRPKIYYISYGQVDGVYDEYGWWSAGVDTALQSKTAKIAVSLDLGLNYKLAQNYILGLTFSDINQPNISLFNNPDVVVPSRIVLGISNINMVYGLNLDIALKGKDFIGCAGVQYKLFKDKLSLFGSTRFTLRNYGSKTVSLVEPSFGAEFSFDGFNISYACNYPLSGVDILGNHTVSLTYRFGPVVKLAEDTSILYAKIDSLEKQLKQKDAEIEELKRKLDELLKKPLPTEKPVPEKKPVTPTKVEEKHEEKVEAKKEMTPKEQYESLFNRYLERKDQLPFIDRVKTVDTIIRQFKDKTDVSMARKEYNELMKQLKQVESELETSKSYYYKLKSGGVDKKTLVDMLERIKKKFAGYGFDLKWVDEELKQYK